MLLLGTLCTWMVPRNASRVHTHPRNAMQLQMHATVHRMSCHGCTPAMHATALFCNFGGRGVWWCMKALTQFRVHRCRTPGVGVLERASCKLQQCDVLTMCCIHIYYICKFSGGLHAPHTSKKVRENPRTISDAAMPALGRRLRSIRLARTPALLSGTG
jgi:hypothetical protein